jgi:hypothetical protein
MAIAIGPRFRTGDRYTESGVYRFDGYLDGTMHFALWQYAEASGSKLHSCKSCSRGSG